MEAKKKAAVVRPRVVYKAVARTKRVTHYSKLNDSMPRSCTGAGSGSGGRSSPSRWVAGGEEGRRAQTELSEKVENDDGAICRYLQVLMRDQKSRVVLFVFAFLLDKENLRSNCGG